MNWLGLLNFFILQWFFIRLGKIKVIDDISLSHFSLDQKNIEKGKNKIKTGFSGVVKKNKYKYKIIKWVIPLTGWSNDYIYLKKKL
jgi:hypothetical protein